MSSESLNPGAVTGIVLAGGRSRRMGQDKALLRLDEQTLLARAKSRLLQWGCGRVCVSGSYPGEECILDSGDGPLSGILACIEHETATALLYIPVDMPFVTSHYFDLLLANYDAHESIAGVSFADARFPLLLSNQERVRSALAASLASGQRSLLGFYERIGVLQLPLAAHDRPAFDNTNTPEQWQAALLRAQFNSV